MSKSYYGLSSTTIDLGNADDLTATGGGASHAYNTGSETFNFAGWMRINPHGGSTSVVGAIAGGNGHGWLLDTVELSGANIPAGTWAAILSLKTSDSSATGDIFVRFGYVDIGTATFTTIGDISLTAQTITTAGAQFNLSGALGAVTIPTGQKLYLEVWWHQTGGGSGTNLMSVSLATTSSGVPGASGGFEIQIPQGALNVDAAATFAGGGTLLASQSTIGQATLAGGGSLVASGYAVRPAAGVPPPKMPLISRGVPAYASTNTYPASRANNATYADAWRSVSVPSVGSPQYVALDLSGVAAISRGRVLVSLLNEQGNQYWNADTSQAISLFADYTLEGNAAAGGALPASGWVPLVTVVGNLYPTRQHIIELGGYNWLRFRCTKSNGAAGINDDISIQIDVHDAHLGYDDAWLFLGDSITLEGMLHPQLGGGDWGYGGALAQIISNASAPGGWYPATVDGGNGGQTTAWAAQHISTLLDGFLGGYVSLAFGTNDCNQSFAFTAGDANVLAYYANLLTCIDAASARGFTVIVPYIPWGSNNGGNLGINANLCNQYVDAHLPTDRPTVKRGPNFWQFFNANPGLIRDGIHPTFVEVSGAASGHERMHLLWSSWMLANVYLYTTPLAVSVVSDSSPAVLSLSDSAPASAALADSAPAVMTISDSGA
jgi:hypothetical protein